jgi:hypothetical protein
MRGLAPAGYCPIKDRALVAWAVVWSLFVLVAFGVVTAIIPNPIFGRGIAPEPFAVAVWIASAPLIGLVMASYFAPMPRTAAFTLTAEAPAGSVDPQPGSGTAESGRGSALGTVGGAAAFIAIGCPTCNKIALVLLGASGATSVFGPLQPVIGAVSLVLLAVTAAWRMRIRARGGACPAPRVRSSAA